MAVMPAVMMVLVKLISVRRNAIDDFIILVLLFVFAKSLFGDSTVDSKNKCTDQQKAGLARHNELRALHGSPPMKMTVALNQAAQAYAEELAAKGQMAHATNLQELGQGENLAWAWSSNGANANYAGSTQQDLVQFLYDSLSMSHT